MYTLNIVILGVILAIIYYEITDVSPGGIVVPGLLVMYINQPIRLIYTLLIATATYFICKLLSKKILIFGKRRFVIMILISLILNLIISGIFKFFNFSLFNFSLIGYTISGLIANDFFKQGIKKTLPSIVIVTGVLEIIILIAAKL